MSVYDQDGLQGDVLILDIGKTHTKLSLHEGGVFGRSNLYPPMKIRSPLQLNGPYPAIDTAAIWNWAMDSIAQMPAKDRITAILPVTHGASLALLNNGQLAFPVMDYEFAPGDEFVARYESVRPPFDQIGSPRMPAMLNAGQQLFYLAETYPMRFASADHIVPLAQYFSFLFSGTLRSEVSALGCHTDLWNPLRGRFSHLAIATEWSARFPPLANAFASVGFIRPSLTARLGLASDVIVLAGCHDSSFEFAQAEAQCGINIGTLSTGTWFVATTRAQSNGRACTNADISYGVSIDGSATVSARFMGGRLVEGLTQHPTPQDWQRVIESHTIARLSGSGTSVDLAFTGPLCDDPASCAAAAQFFLALNSSRLLDRLEVADRLIVTGAFAENDTFFSLLQLLQRGRRRIEIAAGPKAMPSYDFFGVTEAQMARYLAI